QHGARDEYSNLNRQLHNRIIDIAGQQTAAQTINRLRGQAIATISSCRHNRIGPRFPYPSTWRLSKQLLNGIPMRRQRRCTPIWLRWQKRLPTQLGSETLVSASSANMASPS